VGIEAIREALADDYAAIVVVPTVDLVEQWVRALRRHEIPRVGALRNGRKTSFREADVIVGTVQSLYAAPPTKPDGRVLLVADECHRYGSEQWKHALDASYRRRLGLTATFERTDDGINDLLTYFGNTPVYSIGFERAIADGVVAPYNVQLRSVELTPTERRQYGRADETVKDCRMKLVTRGFTAEPFGAFMREVQDATKDRDDFTSHDLAVRYLKAFSERADILASAQGKEDAVSPSGANGRRFKRRNLVHQPQRRDGDFRTCSQRRARRRASNS
jgi:superfamily II DNA or RNA helicase